ncbi:hypothetical protein SHIRM173S_09012 [Streptomyces hirsutus]
MSAAVTQVNLSTAGAAVRTGGRLPASPVGTLLLGAVPQQTGAADTGLSVPMPPAGRTGPARPST